MPDGVRTEPQTPDPGSPEGPRGARAPVLDPFLGKRSKSWVFSEIQGERMDNVGEKNGRGEYEVTLVFVFG